MNKRDFKNFLLDLLFPKLCFGCQREGSYLCPDCLATLEIMESCFCLCQKPSRIPWPGKCRNCQSSALDGIYFSVSYENALIKKLIRRLKYEPYAKELSQPLALLIITHFNLIQKHFNQDEYALVAVPLTKSKLKKRGFNQSEEIAKILSKSTKIPLISDCLTKEKKTSSQMELSREERLKNIKGSFSVKNAVKIKSKKILLVDDVFTTGSTMQECARILKQAGAKKVWGAAVAREG